MIIRVETKLTLRVGEHYVHQTAVLEADHKDVFIWKALLGREVPASMENVKTAFSLMSEMVSESVWDAIIDNVEELEGEG